MSSTVLLDVHFEIRMLAVSVLIPHIKKKKKKKKKIERVKLLCFDALGGRLTIIKSI